MRGRAESDLRLGEFRGCRNLPLRRSFRARDRAAPDALAALALRLGDEMAEHYAVLERRLDSEGDYAHAADSVRKLMFLERLREEIGDALERSDA